VLGLPPPSPRNSDGDGARGLPTGRHRATVSSERHGLWNVDGEDQLVRRRASKAARSAASSSAGSSATKRATVACRS
jgi:hypothetical protein